MKDYSDLRLPEIAAATEPHLACVLLLDTSGSMSGEPIKNLNEAINRFKEETSANEMTKKRVDIAIVEFSSDVRVVQNFSPIIAMEPVNLEAGGTTNMGAGIETAIDMVKERTKFYASLGTPMFKPWIFMITDGSPNHDISVAAMRIREEESKGTHGKLKFFALGVGNYDRDVLSSLSKRVIELSDMNFGGIFDWMSESMATISVSRVDEEPRLPNLPENARIIPSDW
jgi:uncharacterized protein YegL